MPTQIFNINNYQHLKERECKSRFIYLREPVILSFEDAYKVHQAPTVDEQELTNSKHSLVDKLRNKLSLVRKCVRRKFGNSQKSSDKKLIPNADAYYDELKQAYESIED